MPAPSASPAVATNEMASPAPERELKKQESKKPVENRDLVEKILSYIEERERISNLYADGVDGEKKDARTKSLQKGRARVNFIWVKGHANEAGNVAADALAVAGSRIVHTD